MSHKERGFSVIEGIIAVVVVAAIGVTGYFAYNRMQSASKTPSASDQAQKAVTPTAPSVSKSTDLDKASQALDQTNVDASTTDATELDTQLNSF